MCASSASVNTTGPLSSTAAGAQVAGGASVANVLEDCILMITLLLLPHRAIASTLEIGGWALAVI
jgi:hypothetical protein